MHQLGEAGETGEPDLAGAVTCSVADVGGIAETQVEFGPGVTVLRGRNATNRSSLLRALAAALGSDAASLRAGAEAGRVELTVGEDTCTRVFERTPDGVRTGGEPYLADPTVADHFAFCFAENPARRAVERLDDGADLRDILMAPVDTDRIEAEIDRLRSERADVDEELARLEELAAELPDLEARRTSLERELETAREELAAAEERVSVLESDLASGRDAADVEERLADLREARSALEDARYDLETERETAAELRDDRSAVEAELAGLDPVPGDRLATLDERLAALRSERTALEAEIGELESVVRFNEELLEERADLFEADDAAPADRLVDGERTVDCWTCGSTVPADAVETTLEHLRERRQRAVDRRGQLGDEIDELEAERSTLEDRRERRRELERCLETIDEELERVEAAVERQRDVVAERETTVEELAVELAAVDDGSEPEVEDGAAGSPAGSDATGSTTESDDIGRTARSDATGSTTESDDTGRTARSDATGSTTESDATASASESDAAASRVESEDGPGSEFVERHREARDLAVRVDRLEGELAAVEERVAEVEAELQHRRELEDRREAIEEQIEELRTRVERVERAAVEAFNEHVATVLDVLEYDNLERVWLERRTETVSDGGQTVERRTFAHHVVRAGEAGTTFEDDVANLSESEREVIGLVVALAGYLVHDVAETVPFLLLDSLEAVDADRIAALVDYVADHAEYVVAALLPEDARALDDGYEHVDEV